MRYIVILFALFIHSSEAMAETNTQATLKIFLAKPERGAWFVENDKSHLNVVIQNISSHPVKLYDAWNSWGYDNVRVMWSDDQNNKGIIQRVPGAWDKNFPSTTTLLPGEVMVREVTINSHEWQGWPDLKHETPLHLTAIYESTQQDDGWRGKVESKEVQYQIRDLRH